MPLKFTQFAKAPATRTSVCARCGYRMFQTKRQFWVCGPGCDGAEQCHQVKNVPPMPQPFSPEKESLFKTSKN